MNIQVVPHTEFVDGIMGTDLMDHMHKQAERFGAEFVSRYSYEI
jgi:thioredoxin reductase